jgi:hypothetical protein
MVAPVSFEAIALLGCYAAFIGIALPTLWENLSVFKGYLGLLDP